MKNASRRTLIAGAAAAAAVSIVSPRHVRGADANSKVRIGLVGAGGRGAWIANLFKHHGGYQFTGIADYFQAVADRAGDALGVDKGQRFSGLKGYRRMIDSGKIDAIALETPPYCFPEHVAAAVEAGLHVYMAKPVACDVPGALAVKAAADKATANKKVFLVDFQCRTDPHFIEGVKRVHEGALDGLAMLSSWYTDDGFADPPLTDTVESRLQHLTWVNDDALGGSYLVNAGIHAIDVTLWLAGANPLSAVGASTRRRKAPHGDSHDCYSLTYEFPNGLLLNHRGEHIKNMWGFTCGVHAYGHEAFFEGQYGKKTWLRGGQKPFAGGEDPNFYTTGAQRNIATFHKCVTGGDCSNPTAAPSVNATLATILGREAGIAGTKVTWAEMLKANKRLEPNLKGLKE